MATAHMLAFFFYRDLDCRIGRGGKKGVGCEDLGSRGLPLGVYCWWRVDGWFLVLEEGGICRFGLFGENGLVRVQRL